MGAKPTRSRHCKRSTLRCPGPDRPDPPLSSRLGKARAADSAASQETWPPGASFFGAENAEGAHPVHWPASRRHFLERRQGQLRRPPPRPRALRRRLRWSRCSTKRRRAADRTGCGPKCSTAQADRLGLRRITGRCTWQTYDAAFSAALRRRRRPTASRTSSSATSCSTSIAHGPKRMCAAHGLTAVEPLFGSIDRRAVPRMDRVRRRRDHRDGARGVSRRDAGWAVRCGARCSPSFAALGVDPCGERGEYHTVVTNSPLFSSPIDVVHGEARAARSAAMRWTWSRRSTFEVLKVRADAASR